MRLFPPIKLDAVGYLDMKDAHKKHICLGYGFLLCTLLQAVWKSFWHLAPKEFLHMDEKEPENLWSRSISHEIDAMMTLWSTIMAKITDQ